MVEKIKILEMVSAALEGSDKFLVSMKITPDNRIFIDIDGDNGVTIDDCIELSRTVEGQLDRDEEDFELTVSSAGADQPLRLVRQYRKNVGREVECEMLDGEKLTGTLSEAGDEEFTLHTAGNKRQPPTDTTVRYRDVKATRVVIRF